MQVCYTLTNGILNQLSYVVYVQFFHYVGAMSIHGLNADIKFGPNLFIGMSLGNQLNNLSLPGG